MERTLIVDSLSKVGETVLIKGWVATRRDHGKIAFLDVGDRTGIIQVISTGEEISGLKPGDVVAIEGLVKTRPEKLVNPKIETGKVELEVRKVELIFSAETYPFDMGKPELDLELPTLLDYRSLTLRHPRVKAIFKVQEAVAEGFRRAAREIGCTEVFPPTVSASSTEGGAEVFKFDYFGHEAFMVQSPQLYKQMMVGVFERVFLISHIYRAEPSITTRHLVESIQLDCEIGFADFGDLLDALEKTFANTIAYTQEAAAKYMDQLGVPKSKVYSKVPRVTMREAQQIIFDRTGVDHRQEKDLMPEDEKEIAKWALEKFDSDLVTVTHYPTKKRAFYSMPDPKEPEYSLSYDLLYKGLEISSGSQRIDDPNQLVSVIRERGMDPQDFYMYLQAFKYGMPPHGGFSYGLERTTMKLLDLANIREASLYPRDMERVDLRLSILKSKPKAPSGVFEKIKSLLDENKARYQIYEHEPVLTSEQAAKVRGTKLEQGAKALVMYADDHPAMLVMPANLKVDTKQFKSKFKFEDLRMATPEEVKKLTGCEIGAVPPFGNLFKLPLYVDRQLGGNKEIAFNAGLTTKSVKMSYSDFAELSKPILGDFAV